MKIKEKITLNKEALSRFKASLRGQIIQPDDETYDQARKVYNAMIDRHPRIIVRCADTYFNPDSLLVAVLGPESFSPSSGPRPSANP